MQKQSALVLRQRKASFRTSGTRYVLWCRTIYYVTLICMQQMTLREAQILVLRVLKQVMEEKLDQHNVQLAQVFIRFDVT